MNSGVQVVQYLHERPVLVKGKVVVDMGTGRGVIGIAAALLGAKKVLMADIDERAVANAKKNIARLKLGAVCEALQSDLFYEFHKREKADVHIFNHPFFAGNPRRRKEWTRIMLGGNALLGRYFAAAHRYATKDVVYILPWVALAGNRTGATMIRESGRHASRIFTNYA